MIFSGKVIKGDAVGRTIGFPTANLDQIPDDQDLKPGVYLGHCQIAQLPTTYSCLIYFGPRLIFGETKNSFEVYIYDFHTDLYGQTLIVRVGQFIRPPMKFANLEALKTQLQKDREHGRLLLSHDWPNF